MAHGQKTKGDMKPVSLKFKTPSDYILKLRGKIVYVGHTTNIFSRIVGHAAYKKFDEVEIRQCENGNSRESHLITKHCPPLNKDVSRAEKIRRGARLLKCLRCDHEWLTKNKIKPHCCPACKQYKWNKPKV